MDIGRFLAPQDHPGMIDDVFLAEHRDEQRVFFLVVQGADPFCQFGKRSMLQRLSKEDLLAHAKLRTLANNALEGMKAIFDSTTEVLVWPHHFDTGMLGYFEGMKHMSSVGLGVAMPDDQFGQPYCYLAAYNDQGTIQVNDFQSLSSGECSRPAFVGAVLPIADQTPTRLTAFMKEALAAYTNMA